MCRGCVLVEKTSPTYENTFPPHPLHMFLAEDAQGSRKHIPYTSYEHTSPTPQLPLRAAHLGSAHVLEEDCTFSVGDVSSTSTERRHAPHTRCISSSEPCTFSEDREETSEPCTFSEDREETSYEDREETCCTHPLYILFEENVQGSREYISYHGWSGEGS